ncbi:PREDICTED: organic cation transporter 1-like [Priapulus caudatus]|uniref:Organic cation transporter 1-like n=1 Tax=Priapulus caudatus TaxID=37621 RepID=A0ABM1EBV5_PRICU|nr:PREDICTED: organic cation transporter 1-like [Priapulus caudatus]
MNSHRGEITYGSTESIDHRSSSPLSKLQGLEDTCRQQHSSEKMVQDFDDVLPRIGSWGRYQKLLFWLVCIPACIPCAFQGYVTIFLLAVPDHWCHVEELKEYADDDKKGLSIPIEYKQGVESYAQCVMYDANYSELVAQNGSWQPDMSWPIIDCDDAWDFDQTLYDSTTSTAWDIVCDRVWITPLVFSIISLGNLCGNYIFGFLQDRLGRKLSFFICLTLQLVAAVASAFAPEPISFTFFRFLVGLTIPAIFTIPFVIGIELVGPEKRSFTTLMQCMAYSVGLCLLPGVAYLVREWRHLALATSLPFAIFYVYWFFMPESARWLMANNKVAEAERLVQKIAKVNGKEIPVNILSENLNPKEDTAGIDDGNEEAPQTARKYNFRDLFRTKNLRNKTLLISFIWFANSTVYVGLNLYIPLLGSSDYLNMLLSALAEMLGYPFLWLVLDRWGRRGPLCLAMVVSGVACITTVLVPLDDDHLWITIMLTVIGKFGISASFVDIYLIAGEVYPTVVRGLGTGFSQFVAALGTIAVPYVVYIGKDYQTFI